MDGRVLFQAVLASEQIGSVLAHLETLIFGQAVSGEGGAATLAAGVLHALPWCKVLLVKSRLRPGDCAQV